MHKLLRPETFRARALRRTSTTAERALWVHLRGRILDGVKFRRQAPVGPFIVDFLCAEAGLIVEADGGYHLATQKRDFARDQWLRSVGYTVLRLSNDEILHAPDAALDRIRRELRRLGRLTPPLPPGEGAGG